MNKYVQVSYDVYNLIEKATVKQVDCVITYFNELKGKTTITSKVIDLRSVNNSEFIEIEDGSTIRLDKVLSFNGENISNINHY